MAITPVIDRLSPVYAFLTLVASFLPLVVLVLK